MKEMEERMPRPQAPLTTAPGTIPRRGDRIPDFTATTADAVALRTRDYYMRRNLALIFSHEPDCTACRDVLRAAARQHAAARAEAGEVIPVVPADRAAVARLRDDLNLSFPLVADEDLAVHARYGLVTSQGEPMAAILVTDRYGTVYEASVAGADHRLMAAEEIPGWLEFVVCECS